MYSKSESDIMYFLDVLDLGVFQKYSVIPGTEQIELAHTDRKYLSDYSWHFFAFEFVYLFPSSTSTYCRIINGARNRSACTIKPKTNTNTAKSASKDFAKVLCPRSRGNLKSCRDC